MFTVRFDSSCTLLKLVLITNHHKTTYIVIKISQAHVRLLRRSQIPRTFHGVKVFTTILILTYHFIYCLKPLSTIFNIQLYCGGQFLLVEETAVPGENHHPVASHWQTLSHNVVSSTPHLGGSRTHNVSGNIH